ncbi:ABC-type cobalt transport system, ATPase component [Weissella oryzae SG25]|uniref:ABC-type cobalt transport system, ATPase component n=1 Tax=Weissella oryzae (strain DSM 25784 / JCM 18191 / LMG 30913 / SG25) TaxID=1329250 RepID=A0A069CQI9_WEIOS|nr:energy-coupling factor ABC transporter ATP-binding protein [Weissella oryzae]GAK29935.1 ABC-type cobalt transport system, ATPase component [Weissella oryzae SG25]
MVELITLQDVSYTYPNNPKPALNNINLSINQGEWVALIGHNGSGKSTFAKLLNYLLAADSGEITIAGVPVLPENMWTIRDLVGMVFQNPDNQFVGATVADDVAFGMENRGIERATMLKRVAEVLDLVKMSEFADREPAHLSGGQKQRVAIASVLAIRPKVLILDEATAMLDPQGRREMVAIVRKLKAHMGDDLTVISITHDIEEAASADRIIVINDGELIASGEPAQIFGDAASLKRFGLAVPFAEELKAQLAVRGVAVPAEYLTMEGMVAWLWQSISKK